MKLAQKRNLPLWQRNALLSGFIGGNVFYGDPVLCEDVSLDTGDQSGGSKGP